jgi:hypothetical protein
MKKIIFLILFVFCLRPVSAQSIINTELYDVILVPYSCPGGLIRINAGATATWPLMDGDIYYAFTRYESNDGVEVMKKIGFVFLKEKDGDFLFSADNKVPIELTNLSSNRVLLEFNDLAVFISPGSIYEAKTLSINQDLSAVVFLSKAGAGDLSAPEIKGLSFHFSGGVIATSISSND